MTTRPASSSEISATVDRLAINELLADPVAGSSNGDAVAAGIQLAVTDAVDTIVEEALHDAVEAQGDGPAASESQLSLTDAVTADRSGWAAARLSALQAAAATAASEVAKSLAETGTRHAREQDAAAPRFSRDTGTRATALARSQGNRLATAAASNTAMQKISRQTRKAGELQHQQANRLRRRWLAIIALLAAIVGAAVGLYERRRRAASSTLSECYDHDGTVTPTTVEPDSAEEMPADAVPDVG